MGAWGGHATHCTPNADTRTQDHITLQDAGLHPALSFRKSLTLAVGLLMSWPRVGWPTRRWSSSVVWVVVIIPCFLLGGLPPSICCCPWDAEHVISWISPRKNQADDSFLQEGNVFALVLFTKNSCIFGLAFYQRWRLPIKASRRLMMQLILVKTLNTQIEIRWCPPVISCFLIPLTIDSDRYIYQSPSYYCILELNQLSYRTGAPHCMQHSSTYWVCNWSVAPFEHPDRYATFINIPILNPWCGYIC